MINPLNTPTSSSTDLDGQAADLSQHRPTRETGLKGWLHRHFGAEPPSKHSSNFFISDVTEGGIGSHHHRQVFRPDKRH